MQQLTPGDTGPAVADAQRRLRALELVVPDEDGTYGPGTIRAVRMFQRGRRLPADGVIDAETWSALVDAGYGLGDRLLYHTRPMLRGDDVRELQRILSRLGFDTGATDGLHGDDTDAALRDFQHNAGIAVDGIAGAATVRMLHSLRRRHQAATTFEVLEVHDAPTRRSLTGCRIVVDPAPVEHDRVLIEDGPRGQDVVADVSRRLVSLLIARGAHAMLAAPAHDGAPVPDTSQRALLANRIVADAVVSVAVEWLDQQAVHGVSAHHFGDGVVLSDRGRRLAMHCVDEVAERAGAVNCDIHPSTATLLRESRAPAVTVEIGYPTNAEDAQRLALPAHRHAIADALARAIQDWAAASDD